MKNILIHCAMAKEGEIIAKKLELVKNIEDKIYATYKGKIKETEINLVITGIGKQKTAIGLTKYLCENEKPEIIINIGYAGSLEKIKKQKKLPCYSSETFVTKTDIKEKVIFDMELHSVSIIADMYKIKLLSLKKISDNLNMDDYYKNIKTENIMELESSIPYIEKYIK